MTAPFEFDPCLHAGCRLLLLLLPLFLAACGSTTKVLPESTTAVRVQVDIEQNTDRITDAPVDREYVEVKVVLLDLKGKAIEASAVQVLLNEEPLVFRVGQGNYYDRYPFWRATDEQLARLGPGAECRFDVVWPDGQRYPVGTVTTARRLSMDAFDISRVFRGDRPFVIGWHRLTIPAKLVVYRGYSYPDEFGNSVQLAGASSDTKAIRKTIGPGFLRGGDGRLIVPVSYFKEQPGESVSGMKPMQVNALHVEVSADVRVPAGPAFHPASYIHAKRLLLFYMEITADSLAG